VNAVTSNAPFPVDALAPWQREMVLAVAANAQTEPAMAAMFCLGFSSFTVARNVQIMDSSGATDALALWIVVIAESTGGKSRTFRPLVEPLLNLDRMLRGRPVRPDPPAPPPEARTSRTAYARLLDDSDPWDTEASTAAPDPAPWATAQHVHDQIAAAQAALHPGHPLRFYARRITPEALTNQMDTQIMGILQASPEGQFFTHIAGGGPRAVGALANFNSMWDGEPIHEDRVGSLPGSPDRPVLTLVVAPQPAALQEVRRGNLGRLVEHTGFLLRCLLYQAPSNVGQLQPRSQLVDERTRILYAENLRAMLSVGAASAAPPTPRTLTPTSYVAWDAFFTEVERRRGPGGNLHDVAGWAARVRQSTARIAGVLHVATYAATERTACLARPVSEDTFERAIRIGRWLLDHGHRVVTHAAHENRVDAPPPRHLLEIVRTIVAVGGAWEGQAAELLAAIRRAAPDAQLPAQANQLSRILRDAHSNGTLTTSFGMVLEAVPRVGSRRTIRLRLVG